MREALLRINSKHVWTPCAGRPIPYEVRQTPRESARLCGRGTDNPCPVLEQCTDFGFTHSVYADDMTFGGYIWKRGVPVVSETAFSPNPSRARPKISNGSQSLYS